MYNINAVYLSVLEYICNLLYGTRITWALTGSLNLALQGVDIKANDIDIISDKRGVYQIESIFKEHIKKPVNYEELPQLRSHFGILLISGIPIDIMGDVENKVNNNKWEPHINWKQHIHVINIGMVRVPSLDLEYEYLIYSKIGDKQKSEKILNYLQVAQKQG